MKRANLFWERTGCAWLNPLRYPEKYAGLADAYM
jgi:hypothetical protein